MKKMLLPILIIAMTSGCVTLQRTESLSNNRYEKPSEAVTQVSSIGTLTKGDSVQIKIDAEKSPSLKAGIFTDYFEVIGIHGEKDADFNLIFAPICDCFGFSKWEVFVRAGLYDSNGVLIASDIPTKDLGVKKLTGKFPATGDYRVLVEADSSHLNENINFATGYYAGLAVLTVPIVVHKTGKVLIQWVK